MIKKTNNLALTVFVAALSASPFVALAEEDIHVEAQQTVESFKKTDTSFQNFLSNAAGYAVFSNIGKGGFIVGGARGKGLVYEKSNIIGIATMTQASFGAQAGGQTFSEIICFENPAALNDFKAGKFEMSADVGAVVAAEGASKAAKYKDGVAVFTMPKKGLMVQAAVGGQKFKFQPMAVGAPPTGEQDKSKK
jgi:lipid-binding SYLF domain-containing protein